MNSRRVDEVIVEIDGKMNDFKHMESTVQSDKLRIKKNILARCNG